MKKVALLMFLWNCVVSIMCKRIWTKIIKSHINISLCIAMKGSKLKCLSIINNPFTAWSTCMLALVRQPMYNCINVWEWKKRDWFMISTRHNYRKNVHILPCISEISCRQYDNIASINNHTFRAVKYLILCNEMYNCTFWKIIVGR